MGSVYNGKTCFFLGHRDAPDDLLPALEREVERHITQYGVTEFAAGHYGRFDAPAARAVKNAKERPRAVTFAVLPLLVKTILLGLGLVLFRHPQLLSKPGEELLGGYEFQFASCQLP